MIEDCNGTDTIYLFNLVNCGKFAAKDVRFCILTGAKVRNVSQIDRTRWKAINHHSGFPTNAQSGDMVPVYIGKGDLDLKM